MSLAKKIKVQELIVAVFTCLLFMVSCQSGDISTSTEGADGTASVSINLVSIGSDSTSELKSGVVSGALSENEVIASSKPIVVPVDDYYSIVATLTPELQSQSSTTRTTTVSQSLGAGVKYRVIAYDSNGNYVSYKDFAYGNESTVGRFSGLTAGNTYTFVAYSVNSTSTLPDISAGNTSTLNNAAIAFNSFGTTSSDQFMYFKKSLTVQYGDNYLDLTLAHKFSQIKTKLSITGNALNKNAYFVNISNPHFTPMASSASVSLSDGTVTYGANKSTSVGKTIVFPSFSTGINSLTADSTTLVHAATDTARLIIDALTIKGDASDYRTDITRSVNIPNLSITPGHRYNLNLNVSVPCVQVVEVSKSFSWKYTKEEAGTVGSTITNTATCPAADYGFVFDLDSLDNSFQLIINNVPIATQELQFQNTANLTQNIKFADGSYWNNGTVSDIWTIFGSKSANKPALRIVINENGNVSVYGSKYSASSSKWGLYPIVFTTASGGKFNTVTWNKTSTNTITVKQTVQGQTWFTGRGRGFKLITDCNN